MFFPTVDYNKYAVYECLPQPISSSSSSPPPPSIHPSSPHFPPLLQYLGQNPLSTVHGDAHSACHVALCVCARVWCVSTRLDRCVTLNRFLSPTHTARSAPSVTWCQMPDEAQLARRRAARLTDLLVHHPPSSGPAYSHQTNTTGTNFEK